MPFYTPYSGIYTYHYPDSKMPASRNTDKNSDKSSSSRTTLCVTNKDSSRVMGPESPGSNKLTKGKLPKRVSNGASSRNGSRDGGQPKEETILDSTESIDSTNSSTSSDVSSATSSEGNSHNGNHTADENAAKIRHLEALIRRMERQMEAPIEKKSAAKPQPMTVESLPYSTGYESWEQEVISMAISSSRQTTKYSNYFEESKVLTSLIGQLSKWQKAIIELKQKQPECLADADLVLYNALHRLVNRDSRHIGNAIKQVIIDLELQHHGVCLLKVIEYHFRRDMPTRQANTIIQVCDLQVSTASLQDLPEYFNKHKEILRELRTTDLDKDSEPFCDRLMKVMLYQRLKACRNPRTEALIGTYNASKSAKTLDSLYKATASLIDEISKDRLDQETHEYVAPFVERKRRFIDHPRNAAIKKPRVFGNRNSFNRRYTRRPDGLAKENQRDTHYHPHNTHEKERSHTFAPAKQEHVLPSKRKYTNK